MGGQGEEANRARCAAWLINLCGGTCVELSGRELVRLIGVGTSIRGHNKAADTHANWLMDNGDSEPGAQWEASDLHEKLQKTLHILMSFDGARRESGLGCGFLDIMVALRNWILRKDFLWWMCAEEYLGDDS